MVTRDRKLAEMLCRFAIAVARSAIRHRLVHVQLETLCRKSKKPVL
jgi:hypothetical protein